MGLNPIYWKTEQSSDGNWVNWSTPLTHECKRITSPEQEKESRKQYIATLKHDKAYLQGIIKRIDKETKP